MTPDTFTNLVQALLLRRPFQPFTVELNTGERFEVDHALAAGIRDGRATFIAPGGIPHWFDHESVNQIIQSPANSQP